MHVDPTKEHRKFNLNFIVIISSYRYCVSRILILEGQRYQPARRYNSDEFCLMTNLLSRGQRRNMWVVADPQMLIRFIVRRHISSNFDNDVPVLPLSDGTSVVNYPAQKHSPILREFTYT